MTIITREKVDELSGFEDTLGEFIFNLYTDCVAASPAWVGVGMGATDQSVRDANAAPAFSMGMSIQMVDNTIVEGYNLFDFVSALIDEVGTGNSCTYSLSEFIYAIPDIHGTIQVQYDDGN